MTDVSKAKIVRGDNSMTIDGHKVLKIWESFSGWYWYATKSEGYRETVFDDNDHIWFGYVQGNFDEWGSWSEAELKDAGVWEVPQSNWEWTGRFEKSHTKDKEDDIISKVYARKLCPACGSTEVYYDKYDPATLKDCPYCEGTYLPEDTHCPFCGKQVVSDEELEAEIQYEKDLETYHKMMKSHIEEDRGEWFDVEYRCPECGKKFWRPVFEDIQRDIFLHMQTHEETKDLDTTSFDSIPEDFIRLIRRKAGRTCGWQKMKKSHIEEDRGAEFEVDYLCPVCGKKFDGSDFADIKREIFAHMKTHEETKDLGTMADFIRLIRRKAGRWSNDTSDPEPFYESRDYYVSVNTKYRHGHVVCFHCDENLERGKDGGVLSWDRLVDNALQHLKDKHGLEQGLWKKAYWSKKKAGLLDEKLKREERKMHDYLQSVITRYENELN